MAKSNIVIKQRNVTLSSGAIDAPVIQDFSDSRIPIIGVTRLLRGNKVGFMDLMTSLSKKYGGKVGAKTTASLYKWRIVQRMDSMASIIIGTSGNPSYTSSGKATNFNIVIKDLIATRGTVLKLVDDSSEILITSSGRTVPGGFEHSAQIAQSQGRTFNYQFLASGQRISVRGSAFEEGSSTSTDILRAMPKEADLFHATQIMRKRAKITGSAATMKYDLIGAQKFDTPALESQYLQKLKPMDGEQMFYLPKIVTDLRNGTNESLLVQHIREMESTLLKGRANFDVVTGTYVNETLEDGKPIYKTAGVLDQLFATNLAIQCVYDINQTPKQKYDKLDAIGKNLRDQIKATGAITIITCGGRLLKESLFYEAWKHYSSLFNVQLDSFRFPDISNMYEIDFTWGKYQFVELDELTKSFDGESSLMINYNGSQEEQLSGFGFSFIKPEMGSDTGMPLHIRAKGDEYRDRTLIGGYIPGLTGTSNNSRFGSDGIFRATSQFYGDRMPSFANLGSAEDADSYLTLSDISVVVENPIDMIVYKPKQAIAFN